MLYQEEREKGELTKVEDTENHVIYIVRFEGRNYDESCREKFYALNNSYPMMYSLVHFRNLM